MTTVAVLDYGSGNLRSAVQALRHVGAEVVVGGRRGRRSGHGPEGTAADGRTVGGRRWVDAQTGQPLRVAGDPTDGSLKGCQ